MSRWLILLLLYTTGLYAQMGTVSPFTLPGWWSYADYLLVWRKERFYPPLVTTSPAGTSEGVAGVLGQSTTSILFGGQDMGNAPESGVQGEFGVWVTKCVGAAVGAFVLGTERMGYSIVSNSVGAPIIARPYTNTSGAPTAQLLSFPNVSTNGTVDIYTNNSIWGWDIYARLRKIRNRRLTLDFLGGFIWTQLIDDLDIVAWNIPSGAAGATNTQDQFFCSNQYYAGLVGLDLEWCCGCLRLDLTGKMGLGSMVDSVTITGSTITPTPTTYSGGLLALPTNIGTYSRAMFEICTFVDAKVRYSILGHLFLELGYNFLYWPRVSLAGNQVDLTVNTTQQQGGTLAGSATPVFLNTLSSFWTQGISAGLHLVY